MAILEFALFAGLSSLVIISMLFAAVKTNVHTISDPVCVVGSVWSALFSAATFCNDLLSDNPFLHRLFSGNKKPYRRIPVIIVQPNLYGSLAGLRSGSSRLCIAFSIL